jgi:tetratricopeptide (TPR) repeat protein
MSKTAGFRLARLLMLAAIIGCWSNQVSASSPGPRTLTITTNSAEAKSHFEQGLFDVQNIHPAGALKHFTDAIEADPSFGLAKVLAASVNGSLSQDEQKALSDEGLAVMTNASASELLFAHAVRAFDANNMEQAAELYSALADLVPDDANVAYFAAQFAGPFNSATRMAALAKVAERFPDHAASQNMLAYDNWQLGNRDAAIKAVTRYVELAPNHPNSHDSYGEMMLNMGLFDASVASYRKAVEVDPNYWQGYQGLAKALVFNGDADGARAALEEAASRAPSANARYNMHRGMAVTYLVEDDKKGAQRTFEQIVKDTDGNPEAARARTLAYFQLAGMAALDGKTKDAHAYLRGADSSRPESWSGYQQFMTALVHVWTGDIHSAHEVVKEMDEEDDLLIGAIALAEGRHAEAAASFQETGLESALERIYMAKCASEMGNESSAQALVRDIHQLDEMDIFDPVEPLAHLLEEDI